MLPEKLKCREATRLLLEAEERELSAAEQLALKLHLKICDACVRFVSQVDFMRRATHAWRKHRESNDDPPPG
jgi:predicted GTPase